MRRVLLAFLALGLASCGSLTDLHGIQGRGGDADKALENGVRRLLDEPAIGFSYYSATSTEEYSVTLSGTVLVGKRSWTAKGRLTTPIPGDANSFELRSIGEERWIGLAFRPGPPRCWYPITDELEGLPAIDTGIPGFVSVLENLQSAQWQLGEQSWLTARLTLSDAAMIAATFMLTTSELAPPEDSAGAVPVTISLKDGTIHDLAMTGKELVAAYEQGGVKLSEEVTADLLTRDMRLTFGGPTVPTVKEPESSRVNDGVHRVPGCPKPRSETASA